MVEEKNMSIEKLSSATEIPVETIRQIEDGKYIPTVKTTLILSAALEVKAEKMFCI